MSANAKGSVDPGITREAILNFDAFPCNIPTLSFGLNDIGFQQKLLSDAHNFAERTFCEVLEVDEDGFSRWLALTSNEDLEHYILVSSVPNPQVTTDTVLKQNVSKRRKKVSCRVFCVDLQPCEDAAFGAQISLSAMNVQQLLNALAVRPEFIPLMLGQFGGNYLPPSHFQQYNYSDKLEALDFICQQPRWGFRLRKWPISTWIRFSESEQCTTSIVSYGLEDERITVVQTRLAACFQGSDKVSAATANASDPFLLPTMISHECFMQSDRGVFELGNRLYSALDAVDKVSEEKYNRDDLASITSKLHQVSQDAESLIQSTDIAISILDGMVDAQESLARSSCVRSKHQVQLSINASGYLKRAVEARKRWLEGAKSRKETTMNLVYNLVNQKEAETSIAIARDTKDDSSSMKAIAALTMVFLPATAVTSFFGMGFFDGGGGNFTVAPEWWIFLAVTVPLTIGLVVIWWMWDTLRVQAAGCEAFMNSAPRLRRACWSLLSSRRRRPEEAQSSAKYVV